MNKRQSNLILEVANIGILVRHFYSFLVSLSRSVQVRKLLAVAILELLLLPLVSSESLAARQSRTLDVGLTTRDLKIEQCKRGQPMPMMQFHIDTSPIKATKQGRVIPGTMDVLSDSTRPSWPLYFALESECVALPLTNLGKGPRSPKPAGTDSARRWNRTSKEKMGFDLCYEPQEFGTYKLKLTLFAGTDKHCVDSHDNSDVEKCSAKVFEYFVIVLPHDQDVTERRDDLQVTDGFYWMRFNEKDDLGFRIWKKPTNKTFREGKLRHEPAIFALEDIADWNLTKVGFVDTYQDYMMTAANEKKEADLERQAYVLGAEPPFSYSVPKQKSIRAVDVYCKRDNWTKVFPIELKKEVRRYHSGMSKPSPAQETLKRTLVCTVDASPRTGETRTLRFDYRTSQEQLPSDRFVHDSVNDKQYKCSLSANGPLTLSGLRNVKVTNSKTDSNKFICTFGHMGTAILKVENAERDLTLSLPVLPKHEEAIIFDGNSGLTGSAECDFWSTTLFIELAQIPFETPRGETIVPAQDSLVTVKLLTADDSFANAYKSITEKVEPRKILELTEGIDWFMPYTYLVAYRDDIPISRPKILISIPKLTALGVLVLTIINAILVSIVPYRGLVKNADGLALENVLVELVGVEKAYTAADGTFSIHFPCGKLLSTEFLRALFWQLELRFSSGKQVSTRKHLSFPYISRFIEEILS